MHRFGDLSTLLKVTDLAGKLMHAIQLNVSHMTVTSSCLFISILISFLEGRGAVSKVV